MLLKKTSQIQKALELAGIVHLDEAIDHKTVYKLSKTLQNPTYQFSNLLQGTEFYFIPKPNKVPTKEYLEMMENARKIVAEKEYLEMTRNVEYKSDAVFEVDEWKMVSNQLTAIINILISVVAVFVAVFYLGELNQVDIGLKVLFSLAGALIVAIAEGWFFTRDLIHSE
jgi:hypothetical protein